MFQIQKQWEMVIDSSPLSIKESDPLSRTSSMGLMIDQSLKIRNAPYATWLAHFGVWIVE
jgi:hypothetical protein